MVKRSLYVHTLKGFETSNIVEIDILSRDVNASS